MNYNELIATLFDLSKNINNDATRFWHPERRPSVMFQMFPHTRNGYATSQVRCYMMGYKNYDDCSYSFYIDSNKPYVVMTSGSKENEIKYEKAISLLKELYDSVSKVNPEDVEVMGDIDACLVEEDTNENQL